MQMLGIPPRTAAASAPAARPQPAAPAAQAPAAAPAGGDAPAGGIQLSQLANILAGLGLPPAPAPSTNAPAGSNPPAAATPASTGEVTSAPAAGGLTADDLQRAMMVCCMLYVLML